MFCLYLQAPFGVARTFTAGSFRPTAEFISYSATYGLLLNVAGIEMRHDDGESVMTLIKPNLPKFRLALGARSFPLQHSIYQQLHNYPVGSETGKQYEPGAKGSKYNITPTRRAFLSDIRAYIALDADGEFESQVLAGLKGESPRTYGLPFLGDNSFLLDKLAKVEQPEPAYWYVPVLPHAAGGLRERVTRLSVTIDRADMSRTTSQLFAPTKEPVAEIPAQAWVHVRY
jgi:CRISPR-associated protein Cas5t